jgi:NAD(P)-dependent dehydrogenase (short-subunit alcohol dehydrogenase family)
MPPRPIFVVAGIGNGSGTGAATARLFSKAGYNIALIARNAESLNKLADEIKSTGGDAGSFPIPSYTPSAVNSAFASIKSHWPSSPLRVALFNAGHFVNKPFLDITPEEVQNSLDNNVVAAFAFAKASILAFKDLDIDESEGAGKRGTLLFTGATASLRGNTTTSAFAAAKFGIRALAQSLAKEFGKENIHVAHSIIDGGIINDRSRSYLPEEAQTNPNVRLSPESVAAAYMYLVRQDRSAWTWELDLRPAHEKW